MRRAVFFLAIVGLVLWAWAGVHADTIILQAEDYMAGGEGVGYHDADSGNNGGAYRSDGVDIESASDGGYNVGWTNAGEWLRLATDPGTWTQDPVFAESKRYLVRARVAGYGGEFGISIDGAAAINNVGLSSTDGWQNWTYSNWAITNSPLTAGSHAVVFNIPSANFNVSYVEFQATDLDYTDPIAQKLDPRTGYYYETIGSQTWDQAYVNSGSLGSFHRVRGTFAVPESRIESEAMGSLGDAWIGLTDATQVSTLDGWDPVATLGTVEGGDESGLPYPAEGVAPVAGQRGYGWKRVDGKPLTFQYWGSGEPNDYPGSAGGEDAAQMTSSGRWNDHNAGVSLGNNDHNLPYLAKYATVLDQVKFQILERKSTGTVGSLSDAEILLSLPEGDAGILEEAVGESYAVSFQDPDAGGGYSNWVRAPFFTNSDADDNNFALKATALVEIPEAGAWTFAVAHDDYSKLTVDGNTVTSSGAVGVDLLTIDFATAGAKALELIFQETGGGAYVQLLAAKGAWPMFHADAFRLIGDEYGGGLRVVPEPATGVLLVTLVLGGWLIRRRKTA